MLARFPFNDLIRLQDELFGSSLPSESAILRPSVDVYEDNDGVHLKADLPGVKPEDLKVEVERGTLTIRGERKAEQVDERGGYRRVERNRGSFSRSFVLRGDVNADEVKADYKDGVLSVHLPKAAVNSRREIAVSAQ